MDQLSKEHRSWNMSRIKNKDTTPELIVRSFLHRNGYRFRLHVKSLPGKPDIVLPKYKTIIEIRGCFWHKHENCLITKIPSTRPEWWLKKLNGNVARDKRVADELLKKGWKILIVWDCLIKKSHKNEKAFFESFLLTSVKTLILGIVKLQEIGINDFRAWYLHAVNNTDGVYYASEK